MEMVCACFFGEGVCLIEWSGLIRDILPDHVTQVTIEKDLEKGFDYRRIRWRKIDESFRH